MRSIAVSIVLVLLSIEGRAQGGPSAGQCDQVRAAIAQHGLHNARKHAMENYGLTLADLRNIEQTCGIVDRANDRGRRTKR
jgi:ribosomal protein S9